MLFYYSTFQGFVIAVTMLRELLDDIRRYRRDREVNSQSYKKLTSLFQVVIFTWETSSLSKR